MYEVVFADHHEWFIGIRMQILLPHDGSGLGVHGVDPGGLLLCAVCQTEINQVIGADDQVVEKPTVAFRVGKLPIP